MSDNNQNNSESPENQNSNSESPISENPGFPSPFFTEDDVKEVMDIDNINKSLSNAVPLYTIDDMIDVWCRGVTNGAILWQYCQDTNRPLPASFEAGLIELVNEVRSSTDKPTTLQDFINNNMVLLGVFDEKQ
jgi:hypothetical protein